MNAWHQAVHIAKSQGHPPPPKEIYENRIQYSTPQHSLTLITPEARLEILETRQALIAALTQIAPYIQAEESHSAAQRVLQGLSQAARSAERLLTRLGELPGTGRVN